MYLKPFQSLIGSASTAYQNLDQRCGIAEKGTAPELWSLQTMTESSH